MKVYNLKIFNKFSSEFHEDDSGKLVTFHCVCLVEDSTQLD